MQQLRRLFSILPVLLFTHGAFSHGVHSTIEKKDDATWTINYTTSKPVKRIAFQRNPDNSRAKRWKPHNTRFKITFENAQEFIVRKDGKEFTQATFSLTPTHKRFSKDYAPFSPFSDGGTLIYSGRFFACENNCTENEWEFTLKFPDGEHAVLKGDTVDSSVTWVDSNSGQNIYLGKQHPSDTNGFIAMIDENLPVEIKRSLESYVPELTAYFKSKLGELPGDHKPELYVSYSQTKGPSIRGGVLPNQIFVHLDDDDIETFSSNKDFLTDLQWSFAHEIAHYFQQADKLNIKPNESWIHEGHAEAIAYGVLTQLYPDTEQYTDEKITGFKKKCVDHLATTSLENAAKNGTFSAYYSCGFLIHHAIASSYDDELKRMASPYATWNKFRASTRDELKTSKELFIETIAELRDDDLAKKLEEFISVKHVNPKHAIQKLLDQK